MNKPIGENSSLNISLPMLIQAVGFIAAIKPTACISIGKLIFKLEFSPIGLFIVFTHTVYTNY